MTSSLPLHNKTVLVPREKSQAKAFSDLVKKYGGTPVEIPLLAFKSAELTPELQAAMKKIESYDWIIFTSKVAVETFLSYWGENVPDLPKIAAIGAKTAHILARKGLSTDFFPNEYVAEAFVAEFSPRLKRGTRVLIPKGNLARDYISTELKKIGAIVDEWIVYETFFPAESKERLAEMLAGNQLDIIPFTSPSTVDHFMEVVEENGLKDKIKTCIFACIGPVAKERAEDRGLPVHAVPPVYTVENMLQAVNEYVRNTSC